MSDNSSTEPSRRRNRLPTRLLFAFAALAGCGGGGGGNSPPINTAPVCQTGSDVLASLGLCRNWIAFEPPAPFDPTHGVAAPESATRVALQQLFNQGWRGIVTYSLDPTQGLDRAPRLAKEIGFRFVVAGLFWFDDAQLSRERSAAMAQSQYIDAYVLGNEGLFEGRYSKTRLTSEIASLRAATGRPVTTSEPDLSYEQDPSLLALGDWVFPNIHPWFSNYRSPSDAAVFVRDRVSFLQQLAPASTIIVKECWWPTGGGDAAANEQNQVIFFTALAGLSPPPKFVWGEAYDQFWKTAEGSQGPHWGLHDSQRSAKRVLFELAPLYTGSY